MDITTYGYRQVETGDKAKGTNGWFASIVFDINRLDGHNHDGNNSALLTFANFTPYSNTILAAGWAVDGAGYKQTISTPAGITEVNDYNMKFIFTAPGGVVGQVAYLGYKRLSATTYEVYCNDITAAFTVLYR